MTEISLVPQPTCSWKSDGDPVYTASSVPQNDNDEEILTKTNIRRCLVCLAGPQFSHISRRPVEIRIRREERSVVEEYHHPHTVVVEEYHHPHTVVVKEYQHYVHTTVVSCCFSLCLNVFSILQEQLKQGSWAKGMLLG